MGVVKGRFVIAVIYFSNVLWDHIPNANCSGVKGEHCCVDAATDGHGFLWCSFNWALCHMVNLFHEMDKEGGP